MSDDKIAEIRERHTMYPPSRPSSSSRYSFIVAYQDIATLLAEDERHRAENERQRAALRWYADPRNHFPVERRSPGAPDPAVIFVEEPPIMLDGGERARRALEGKT